MSLSFALGNIWMVWRNQHEMVEFATIAVAILLPLGPLCNNGSKPPTGACTPKVAGLPPVGGYAPLEATDGW